MVAIGTNVWVLLHIATAVLKLLHGAMRAVNGIGMHKNGVVQVVNTVVNQPRCKAVNTHYGVVIGLAVITFFAAGVSN